MMSWWRRLYCFDFLYIAIPTKSASWLIDSSTLITYPTTSFFTTHATLVITLRRKALGLKDDLYFPYEFPFGDYYD